MKSITCALLMGTFPSVYAQHEANEQPEATTYRVEAFGSVATEQNTPFWITSNQYGVVPLDAGNGFMRAGVFHNQTFGKGFRWSAGLDVVAAVPRYRNVYLQQVYAELGYKSLLLSIGSKENYISLWDRWLSSGDMVQSTNARPIPEINLSMPEFTVIPLTKGWLQVKGNFAVGRSFDTRFLEDFTKSVYTYNKNTLWHHKSLFLRIGDTRGGKPFSVTLGGRHWAQWGGDSSNPAIGKQPRSFKDFLRIVVCKEGGTNASESDRINVLGNHYGSFDFKASYEKENWSAHAYWQHYFEDKSGMEYANAQDGLWGVELQLHKFKWVRKVVGEYLNTRYQSGPFHNIEYHRPARGGGADNYYNNGEYTTGVSYFGRALGSPLLTSPIYNTDGYLGFKNNRVTTYHLGVEGTLSDYVDYRTLLSVMNSWGTTYAPFLNNKPGTSFLAAITYRHPKLKGWEFNGSIAIDGGALYGNNVGFSLSVVKRGILKGWGI